MRRFLPILAVLLGVTPVVGAAQIAWDAPTLIGPGSESGLGIFLLDPHPGSDVAAMITWRESGAPGSVGFRGGIGEGVANELAIFLGVDVIGKVIDASDDFPLDGIWILGAGFSVGEFGLISVPAAFSFGRTFESDGVLFRPYAGPKVHLDAQIGDGEGRNDDDIELGFSLDLGTDVRFTDEFAIQFGASIGDRESLAVGVKIGG